MTFTRLIATLAFAVAVGMAAGQVAAGQAEVLFGQMDRNDNEMISAEEVQAYRAKLGTIPAGTEPSEMIIQYVAAFDKDGDGELNSDEAAPVITSLLSLLAGSKYLD
jgi:uncharacterized protein with FMN-binding domain